MSQLEKNKNKIYSLAFPAMVAGVGAVQNPANFGAASKILSIVRTVVGGVVGNPVTRPVQPSGAGAQSNPGIGLFSTNAGDLSQYTVYWVNEYNPSPNYVQGGALIGAQFSP